MYHQSTGKAHAGVLQNLIVQRPGHPDVLLDMTSPCQDTPTQLGIARTPDNECAELLWPGGMLPCMDMIVSSVLAISGQAQIIY